MKLLLKTTLVDSPLTRWDARWRLATLLSALLFIALLRTLPAALIALALVVLLVIVGRVPWRWYIGRVAMVALFLLLFVVWLPLLPTAGATWLIGPLRIGMAGAYAAGVVLTKAIAMTTLILLLWISAPLETTLKAAHALRFPGVLVQLVFLTYRYVFLLVDEFSRLRTALRMRAFRNRGTMHGYRTIGHVSGMLLVRSYERAERVAAAMRCRGFDGNFRCLVDFRTRGSDIVSAVIVSASFAAVLVWDLLSR